MHKFEQKDFRTFQKEVWEYYAVHGRHDLLWRKTDDPYKILVSEVMLQQTHVARVVLKYQLFLKRFPTVQKLASATLADVLTEWQGLGYNRRAKALKHTAEIILQKHNGRLPDNIHDLMLLPGIGTYTAHAVCVFAFQKPIGMIETNIRTVYLHHFFQHRESVRDAEIISLIEATMDTKKPREWFWALMDYGAYLKQSGIKLNEKKVGYKKQSKFNGSDRQIRGAIIRLLTKKEKGKEKRKIYATHTLATFLQETGYEKTRLALQLEKLEKEGLVKSLVKKSKKSWMLAG